MAVNPGFGGQTFIERAQDKIVRMRRLLDGRGARAELEADGGIKSSNIARVIVAGSAIFRPDATVQQAVAELRMAATPLVR